MIKIDSIEFSKAGKLTYSGTVNGDPVEGEMLLCHKDFEKILPQDELDYEYMDQDGLCNGVMDSFNNLFWHIKVGKNIMERRVYLRYIAEDLLYNKYINS